MNSWRAWLTTAVFVAVACLAVGRSREQAAAAAVEQAGDFSAQGISDQTGR